MEDEKKARSRDTRQRFEQWVKNTQCEANVISAVKGIKMARIAKKEGVVETREQSVFAFFRGNVFEAFILKDDGKILIKELIEKGFFVKGDVGFHDFRIRMQGGPYPNHDKSLEAVKKFLVALGSGEKKQLLLVGVTIRIPGGGMLPEAILVIDALAVKIVNGTFDFTVGEIKSYPDKDGYTDGADLSTARAQAGIYVQGLRTFFQKEYSGRNDFKVSEKGFLVFSEPGSNFPSARVDEDLRYQAERAKRGFQKLQEVAEEIEDLDEDESELSVAAAKTEYRPACFQFCDRAPVCLERAYQNLDPIVLGEGVADFIGNINLGRVTELLDGSQPKGAIEEDFLARFSAADIKRAKS